MGRVRSLVRFGSLVHLSSAGLLHSAGPLLTIRIARGCGWQHLGAYVNLGSFYLLGIPMALVLGFLLHFKGMGLWMGIICGSTLQTTLLCIIAIFTNWEHQANMARERTHGEILK